MTKEIYLHVCCCSNFGYQKKDFLKDKPEHYKTFSYEIIISQIKLIVIICMIFKMGKSKDKRIREQRIYLVKNKDKIPLINCNSSHKNTV